MTATTMIVMTTLTFFVKTILTKKLWFVKPEISLSVEVSPPLTPTCRAARLRWFRYLDKPEFLNTSPFGAVAIVPVSAKAAGFCSLLRRIMVARWNGVTYAIQAQDSRGYQIHRINMHMDIFTYERGVILWNWNSFPQAQVELRESKIFRSLCVIQSCYQF